MEAMSVGINLLFQTVHDADLLPGTGEHLKVVLEAARARGLLDDNFISFFYEVLVGFLDKFTIVKKIADDLDLRLQPTRPGSPMSATLNGLYGDNLYDALVALRMPTVAPEIFHLEVALAVQRLAQQDTIDTITHVYAQIIHKDFYMPEEDDRTLAFLDRMATFDGIVQKHVELAATAAGPHPSVGERAH